MAMITFLLELSLIGILAGTFSSIYYKIIREEAPKAVKDFFIRNADKWYWKPLWGCVVCISLHSGWVWYVIFSAKINFPFIALQDWSILWAFQVLLNVLIWIVGAAICISCSIFTDQIGTRIISMIQSTSHKYS